MKNIKNALIGARDLLLRDYRADPDEGMEVRYNKDLYNNLCEAICAVECIESLYDMPRGSTLSIANTFEYGWSYNATNWEDKSNLKRNCGSPQAAINEGLRFLLKTSEPIKSPKDELADALGALMPEETGYMESMDWNSYNLAVKKAKAALAKIGR